MEHITPAPVSHSALLGWSRLRVTQCKKAPPRNFVLQSEKVREALEYTLRKGGEQVGSKVPIVVECGERTREDNSARSGMKVFMTCNGLAIRRSETSVEPPVQQPARQT